MLQVIDVKWRDYLTQMEHLREGVHLASYAQIDPLIEYKTQAYGAFQELITDIEQEIVSDLMKVEIQSIAPVVAPLAPATTTLTNIMERSSAGERLAAKTPGQPRPKKIGRNDPCWCGSGKKIQEVPRGLDC